MMEVITKAQHIADIPNRWNIQYNCLRKASGEDSAVFKTSRQYTTYQRLIAEKELTKEKADLIIGNDSWTELECSGCDRENLQAVAIVTEHDGHPIYLCLECIGEALRSLKHVLRKEGVEEVYYIHGDCSKCGKMCKIVSAGVVCGKCVTSAEKESGVIDV